MSSLKPEILYAAAENLLQATILSTDLTDALERMASASRANGAGFSRVVNGSYSAVPNAAMLETLVLFKHGKAPPPPSKFFLIPPPTARFVTNEATGEPASRSAFYQEFMRPRGLSRWSAAWLGGDNHDVIRFVAYRSDKEGPFYADDTRALDTVLPHLRAAATICRTIRAGDRTSNVLICSA